MTILQKNDLRICDAFLRTAQDSPNTVALREGQECKTYAELERASRALAGQLSDAIPAHSVVAIHGKRNSHLVIAILACARADMTIAVLDSAYPESRILQMLAIIQPALLLTIGAETNEPAPVLGTVLGAIPVWQVNRNSVQKSLHGAAIDQTDPIVRSTSSTAYLLFTSGTTGVPKCIKTGHAPLIHFVQWYVHRFQVRAGDRFSMLSGLGHDPVLRDIFVPLSIGAELCIPDNAIIIHPAKLFDWFYTQGVNFAHATPQLLKILVAGAQAARTLPALRHVFSGGDALRCSHVTALRKLAPACQVVNFYGTTETPQAVAYHVVSATEVVDPIPVGCGISDVTLHVLSDDFLPVPKGEMGQIGIETEYLSNGYLNDADMTRGRFIHLPGQADSASVYLTGDYGVQRADGALILKGRLDDQVKVRGFRVELGDIAAALEAQDDIQSAVVLPSDDSNGETVLVAYLASPTLAAKAATLDSATKLQIRMSLGGLLPSYMVPGRFVVLDVLPLLPNGKLDRARLPKADPEPNEADSLTQLDHPRGQELYEEWKRILGLSHLNARDSFVDMGGDSLSFIQASLAVERVMGWLPPNWDTMSLEKIASSPTRKPQHLSQVGMPILLRAVSIVLVVVAHFGIITIIGTSTLFVIAGLSFGRFQLNNVLHKNHVGPIFSTLAKIVLPALTLIGLRQLVQHNFNFVNLLLIGTLFPPEVHQGKNLWFIDVLVQTYVLLGILLYFNKSRVIARKHHFSAAVLGMLLCMGFAAAQVKLDVLNSYATGISPVKYFWLFLLGVAMAAAKALPQKLLLCGLSLGYLTFSWLYYSPGEVAESFGIYFLCTIPLLVFVNQVRLPKIAARPITTLASASLFIYLTNMTLVRALNVPILNGLSGVKVLVTLVVGILAWWAWDKASDLLMKAKNRLLGSSRAPTPPPVDIPPTYGPL